MAKGERAWVGHHVGDLANYETLRSFTEGIEHFQRLFAVDPEVVAHDLHPEYLSTKYAPELEGVRLIGVQHHHAHLAACLAEHGESGPAVGAIFDGTGYGSDGTVWGGELLFGDLAGFERVGHLLPVRMPGGEAAIRAALADGVRVARRGVRRPAGAPAGAGRFRGPRSLAPGLGAGEERPGVSAHHERGAAVRRRRRALRHPRGGQLRGPGGDRARGRLRPGRARPPIRCR